ncbi:MAG TPA: hypothetical protein PK677_13785 [Acidiphilium sp.]|uniref:hypothetical protein n=1 Tax=unclassified Acidiphilium TaxID=2617493 RepID=UPI00257E064D|nr:MULTISPECIES: hypothetical protein [unclassified Acidiphilium]HQT89598.1 hypothetical protein [Acidiphilium sp.]
MATNNHTGFLYPANNITPTIGAIKALVDRQVAELRALAGSPGERAILTRIATQAITRGLSEGMAS